MKLNIQNSEHFILTNGSPQSDQWITLKCSDKLLKLQDITYTGYPYTENVSLYDLAEDVLINSGFTTGSYIIDEELHNDIIPCGFMRKSSAWEALNDICYAGCVMCISIGIMC